MPARRICHRLTVPSLVRSPTAPPAVRLTQLLRPVCRLWGPLPRWVARAESRGRCEQWIKEGKGAIKWTRLSCRRLQSWQLSPHACDTGADQGLVLTSLKEKLIKIGAKVVSHGR